MDGNRAPLRLFLPILVVATAAPLAWPDLRPVAAWSGLGGWQAGLIGGTFGLAVGAICGLLATLADRQPPKSSSDTILAATCVGAMLGWQAVVPIAAAAVIVHQLVHLAIARPAARIRIPFSAWLGFGTLVWILCWREFAGWTSWL